MITPKERDRRILAALADGPPLTAVAEREKVSKDGQSRRLKRAGGNAGAPNTYALLALAVDQGWIARTRGGWVAPAVSTRAGGGR